MSQNNQGFEKSRTSKPRRSYEDLQAARQRKEKR